MSQDKIQRRRFLADLLFAGGALSAAALAAKAALSSPQPEATPRVEGDLTAPSPCLASPSPEVPTWDDPKISGEVVSPLPEQPHPAGAARPPQMRPPGEPTPAKPKD